MSDADLAERYNYTDFTRETAIPWLRFEHSPPVGSPAPDFPLWELDRTETSLEEVWKASTYTVVEFGSFT